MKPDLLKKTNYNLSEKKEMLSTFQPYPLTARTKPLKPKLTKKSEENDVENFPRQKTFSTLPSKNASRPRTVLGEITNTGKNSQSQHKSTSKPKVLPSLKPVCKNFFKNSFSSVFLKQAIYNPKNNFKCTQKH